MNPTLSGLSFWAPSFLARETNIIPTLDFLEVVNCTYPYRDKKCKAELRTWCFIYIANQKKSVDPTQVIFFSCFKAGSLWPPGGKYIFPVLRNFPLKYSKCKAS